MSIERAPIALQNVEGFSWQVVRPPNYAAENRFSPPMRQMFANQDATFSMVLGRWEGSRKWTFYSNHNTVGLKR